MLKKPRANCLTCGIETAYPGYKYCNNMCQMEFQRRAYLSRWRTGEISGISTIGTVSTYIKNYLRKKFGNQCCICGWSETNPATGVVPLVADHIDGNWRNNIEENLRLLCPNCDSLTPTYAGLNRGNGRTSRVLSNRVKEGRILRNMPP